MACDGDSLSLLRHPAGNTFANFQFDFADQAWMRIFRSSQHQVFAHFIQKVNEAGVSMSNVADQVDDLIDHHVQIEGTGNRLADGMQDPKFLPCQVKGLLYGFDRIRIISSHVQRGRQPRVWSFEARSNAF
jgi:hypothetical protein